MLYHLDFDIEYPASMSQKDLFSIWVRKWLHMDCSLAALFRSQ
jgi:hypothetical protein